MKKIRIAAISTLNWSGQSSRSIENMIVWGKKAVDQGAELIVYPELSLNGCWLTKNIWNVAETIPGPSVDKLVSHAVKLNAILCFGLLEREVDIVYNTQVLVGSNGLIGKQKKIHMPGREYLYIRGGSKINIFNIGKARVGITICYDSLFSEMARSLYFMGAEILIMPFAYSTLERRCFPEKDITGLVYRAHCWENGCYGVLVNNAGKAKLGDGSETTFPGWAGVFNPKGEVVAFTREEGNGESMVIVDLDPEMIAEARRDTFFIPRCLHPEIYRGIKHDSDES